MIKSSVRIFVLFVLNNEKKSTNCIRNGAEVWKKNDERKK